VAIFARVQAPAVYWTREACGVSDTRSGTETRRGGD
jgi:hypothetical protein